MIEEASKSTQNKDSSNHSFSERFKKLVLWVKHIFKEYWFGVFIAALVIPPLFEKLCDFFRWKPFSNVSAADWVMYFATICGAYATLVAVVYTVRDGRIKEELKQQKEDSPFLYASIEMTINSKETGPSFNRYLNWISLVTREATDPVRACGRITLTNLGLGAAINITHEASDDSYFVPNSVIPAKSSNVIDFYLFYKPQLEKRSELYQKKICFHCDSMSGRRFYLVVYVDVFISNEENATDITVEVQRYSEVTL
jgi:hypothetical protein